ncbi:MAG: hypothetical protein II992_09485 [Lachnospiraceae bacterium]|nr:hypothetical protein [Lachnospiraceae bacterium]
MLTIDNKRKFDEQEPYEVEVKTKIKLNAEPQRTNTSDNIMSERLSSDTITNVVVPKLKTLLEIVNVRNEKSKLLNKKTRELSSLNQTLHHSYSNKFITYSTFLIIFYVSIFENNGKFSSYLNEKVNAAIAQGNSPYFTKFVYYIIIPFILAAIISSILKSLYFNKVVAPDLKRKISILNDEIADLQDFIDGYYNANHTLMNFLPERYQTPQAVSCILNLFATFRVDSMKEAFNRCEDLVKFDSATGIQNGN